MDFDRSFASDLFLELSQIALGGYVVVESEDSSLLRDLLKIFLPDRRVLIRQGFELSTP
jgi:hypothetical protein